MRVVNLRVVSVFLFGIFALATWPGQAWFGVPATATAQDDPYGDTTKKAAQDDPFASSKPSRATVSRRAPTVSYDDVPSASKETVENTSTKSNSPSNATTVDDLIRKKLLRTGNAFRHQHYFDTKRE